MITICQIVYIHMTLNQQHSMYDIMPSIELPTLSVTSGEMTAIRIWTITMATRGCRLTISANMGHNMLLAQTNYTVLF